MKAKKDTELFLLLIALLPFLIVFTIEQDFNGYISIVAIVELIGVIYILRHQGFMMDI